MNESRVSSVRFSRREAIGLVFLIAYDCTPHLLKPFAPDTSDASLKT